MDANLETYGAKTMSALAEALLNLSADVLSHVTFPTLRRVGAGLVKLPALVFYAAGRAVLKLFRVPPSATGVPEAIFGFAILMGLIVALVKLPVRLLLAGLMR